MPMSRRDPGSCAPSSTWRFGSGFDASEVTWFPPIASTTTRPSQGRRRSLAPALAGVKSQGSSGRSSSRVTYRFGGWLVSFGFGNVRRITRLSTPVTSPGPIRRRSTGAAAPALVVAVAVTDT